MFFSAPPQVMARQTSGAVGCFSMRHRIPLSSFISSFCAGGGISHTALDLPSFNSILNDLVRIEKFSPAKHLAYCPAVLQRCKQSASCFPVFLQPSVTLPLGHVPPSCQTLSFAFDQEERVQWHFLKPLIPWTDESVA